MSCFKIEKPPAFSQVKRPRYCSLRGYSGARALIEKDNVVIDGNGSMLKIPAHGETDKNQLVKSASPLIQIINKSNIIIKNIIFDKFSAGIRVRNSSNIIIIQNTIKNGNSGISMLRGANCSIIANRIVGNALFGVLILNSTFLNIAYNIVSRNPYCGIEISDGQYSNISRNDFTDNKYIGLYFLGPNSNNRIFENNFINNDVGLDYHGDYNSAVNNTVYNNYWSNYRLQIDDYSADAVSGVDQSPLASPISTSFDPSLFPLPSLAPNPSPEPKSIPEPFPTALVAAASVATIAVVGVGLLVYFKKKRRAK